MPLGPRGPQPINTIGQRINHTGGAVTAAVDRLETRGLVVRRFDPNDRRARFVTLTPEGTKTVGAIFGQHKKVWIDSLTVSPRANERRSLGSSRNSDLLQTKDSRSEDMSESATSHLSNVGSGPGKGLNITLWCLQVLLALTFLGASSAELMGQPQMVEIFKAVGIGQWFRYVTGILELTGAVLIVVPKTRSVGAGLLVAIMLGAVAAHLFILHSAPTAPLVLLLLSGFVVWGRRQELARLPGR